MLLNYSIASIYRTRVSLLLAFVIVPLTCAAQATPTATPTPSPTASPTGTPVPLTIQIKAPSTSDVYDVRPTITIEYLVDPNVGVNTSTLMVDVNGFLWTSKFAIGETTATYAVSADDALVAGPLTIKASISDRNGVQATDERSYTVYPTLAALLPDTAREETQIAIGALGLDPVPGNNVAVFSSIFGAAAGRSVFVTVDRGNNRGTVKVPKGAITGPLYIEVNSKRSREAPTFTVPPDVPQCGDIDDLLAMPDGGWLAFYRSYTSSSINDPSCPAPRSPGQCSGTFPPRAHVIHFPPDRPPAVLAHSSCLPNRATLSITAMARAKDGSDVAIFYNLRSGSTSTPLLALASQSYGTIELQGLGTVVDQADFADDGSLYISTLKTVSGAYSLDLHKLSAANGYQPQLVAANLSDTLFADPAASVSSCDGFVYVAAAVNPTGTQNLNTTIYKIDPATGSSVAQLVMDPPRFAVDLVATCRTNELLLLTGNNGIHGAHDTSGDLWSVSTTAEPPAFGPHRLIKHLPIGVVQALAVTRDGVVEAFHRAVAPGVAWDVVRISTTQVCSIEGTTTALPLCSRSCPAPGVAQLSAENDFTCPTVTISPTTTRWKPWRDVDEPISISFLNERPLVRATITITGPAAIPPIEVVPAAPRTSFTVDWIALDVAGNPAPSGNYEVSISAIQDDGAVARTSAQDPNRTVSLVEVDSIHWEPVDDDPRGLDAFSDNPAVHGVVGQTPDQTRPAEGKRFFAEAQSPTGPILNRVRVRAVIKPDVPDPRGQSPVEVHFRLLDVDDPAPRDPAGNGADADNDPPSMPLAVGDNRGPASIEQPLATAANGAATSVVLVSSQPGDNYRVVASTSSTWVDSIKGYQPSSRGEVRIQDARSGIQLTDDELKSVSPMLTVWRTLHMEVDSMRAQPTSGPRRNFVRGTVTEIADVRRIRPNDPGLPWKIAVLADDRRLLADGSPDRSWGKPGSGFENNLGKGYGRFEGGTLEIGNEPGKKVLDGIFGNGDTYVETPVELTFRINTTPAITGRVMGWNANERVFEVLEPLSKPELLAGQSFVVAGVTWTINRVDANRILVNDGVSLPFLLRDDDAAREPFDIPNGLMTDCLADIACEADVTRNVFAQAYVRVRRDLPSQRQNAFFRNIDLTFEAWAAAAAGGRDDTTVDSSAYWVAYVQGAFQPTTFLQDADGNRYGDDDPNLVLWDSGPGPEGAQVVGSTVAGGTVRPNGSASDGRESLIYRETLRDASQPEKLSRKCPNSSKISEDTVLASTVAHEVGHQFGLQHPPQDNGTLMDADGTCLESRFFSGEALAVIRQRGLRQ